MPSVDHLERWTAEAGGSVTPMAAWEKRVLITQLAGKAWENVCSRFDFEKAATRLGMRMTVDGSEDDKIKLQGLADYSFCDADGGEAGTNSDDEGMDDDLHADVVERDGDQEEGGGEEGGGEEGEEQLDDEDDDEVEGGEMEEDGDDDSDDDTADPNTVRTTIGDASPPQGFSFSAQCPDLESHEQRVKVLGKQVLVGWDQDNVYGWFIGTIHSVSISARDRQKTPSANFVVKYTSQRTGNQLNGCVACELSQRIYGPDKWWVLLEKA